VNFEDLTGMYDSPACWGGRGLRFLVRGAGLEDFLFGGPAGQRPVDPLGPLAERKFLGCDVASEFRGID
jgi:hypothetical protein